MPASGIKTGCASVLATPPLAEGPVWVKSVKSTRRMVCPIHPRSRRACRTVVLPAGAQRPVVRSLLHRGCMSTLDLFMRRFAVETFDPKRRGNEAIWARGKSRLETEFFGEGEFRRRGIDG